MTCPLRDLDERVLEHWGIDELCADMGCGGRAAGPGCGPREEAGPGGAGDRCEWAAGAMAAPRRPPAD